MDSAGRKNAKNATLDILDVLWDSTDDEHSLTAQEIHDELNEKHRDDEDYITPSLRTVRAQLDALKEREILGCTMHKSKNTDGSGERWWMGSLFSSAELRLFNDSLMLSRIETDDLEKLTEKLTRMAGGQGAQNQDKIDAQQHLSSYTHLNEMFLGGIRGINEAINLQCCVQFNYYDFDEHGNFEPRKTRHGHPRIYCLEPYGMVFKQGGYYLIGHFPNRPLPTTDTQKENNTNLWCFFHRTHTQYPGAYR